MLQINIPLIMTQNSDTNGVIKTPDCSFEQFQPTNVNQTNPWELGLRAGEQLARYYEKLVMLCLNNQNSQLSSPNCCSLSRKQLKERIEMERWEKKPPQT